MHVVDICVKAAIKVLALKVDDLLVEIHYHFYHSVFNAYLPFVNMLSFV